MWTARPDLKPWKKLVDRLKEPKYTTRIAVVGKYVDVVDSYKSLHEALKHGGVANNTRVEIEYVDSEEVSPKTVGKLLGIADGVLVPGGFGERGSEGKILAAKYARENKVPYFGICLGMQLAVVEYARNVCRLDGANSSEFADSSDYPVIDLMPGQRDVQDKGATMRLGAYPCALSEGSLAREVYSASEISERHRHRYEVNNEFRQKLEEGGLVLSGVSPDGDLVEVVELQDHPWFLGCQFHPELKSRPMEPHPLFQSFISATLAYAKAKKAA